ncbi:hypothetical protein [Ramlibacter sp.]|uniref:hypothetical protein n=1 Tax=Ramlibacter sp. TaxID=1917967 RepID=UPI003D0962D8
MNQIEPPASFAAIYSSRDGSRLLRPAQEVIARYELCEDLAHALVERATMMLSGSEGNEQRMMEQIREGLVGVGSPLSEPEADWVVLRLRELLE